MSTPSLKLFSLSLLCLFIAACGQKSLVECSATEEAQGKSKNSQCQEKTPDEKAMLALNAGNYELAISLLEPLVASAPKDYFRIPRLAASYASLAGFDLLKAAGASEQSQSNGLDGVASFLPKFDPARRSQYQQLIAYMQKARDLLAESMPADERKASNERFYGASADMQLFLYRSSHSIMLMNSFMVPAADDPKKLDESILNELTEDQAVMILRNLQATAHEAAAAGESSQLAESGDKIDAVLTEIEAEEGADSGERLQNYLKRRQAN